MELLHADVIGTGNPLIILHGFLGMSDNWKSLGKRFAKVGFQVHLLDQRNHGRSFWSEDFDYDLMADDVIRYMDHHGIEKSIILGHSMGGKTAMHLACDHPERIEKLIVADIAPKFYPPHHDYILNALLALPLDRVKTRGEAEDALAKDITDVGIRRFLIRSLHYVGKEKLDFRFNLKVLSGSMEAIGEALPSISTYKGPTLFIRGGLSEYIRDADSDLIRQHFPKANLETIEDTAHWLHAEKPEEFFEICLEFILEGR